MNIHKLLLLLITLLVVSLFVDARQRANKHEDMGFRTGMSRLDMLSRAKRLAPLRMELVQSSDPIRSKREFELFDADTEGDKHRSSGVI